MLMRFDPFRELDRLTDTLGSPLLRIPMMPMDAYRHGDRFVARFDLPGVSPDSVELTVEKNVLTVSAERQWEPEAGTEVVASERPQGSFSRQLFLGDSLDADHIEANYENGVLCVTIPVAEAARPRKVAITSGSGSGTKAISATAA